MLLGGGWAGGDVGPPSRMHCVWRLTELGGERGETVSVTDGVTVNLAIYPEQQALFKNPDPNPDPIPIKL